MSKVALVVTDAGKNKQDLFVVLRRCIPSLSMMDIQKKIGNDVPIFIKELFNDNQDQDFSIRLLEALQAMDDLQVSYNAYEMLYDEFDFDIKNDYFEITTDILINMIEANREIEEEY